MTQRQQTGKSRDQEWQGAGIQPGLEANRRACDELQEVLPAVAQTLRQPVTQPDTMRWRYLDDKIRTGIRQEELAAAQMAQTREDLRAFSDRAIAWWKSPLVILALLAALAAIAYGLITAWPVHTFRPTTVQAPPQQAAQKCPMA